MPRRTRSQLIHPYELVAEERRFESLDRLRRQLRRAATAVRRAGAWR